MIRLLTLAAAFIAALAAAPLAPAREEPRTIVVLYDGGQDATALVYAAPVLKHLGLIVEAHNAADPLPDLTGRADLRGVLIWLDEGSIADRAALSPWVRGAVRQAVPVVLMGAMPEADDRFGLFLALDLLYSHDARGYTYDLRAVEREPGAVEVDRHFNNLFPAVDTIRPLQASDAQSLLVLQRRSDTADRTTPLIVTAKGGFAADGYALWSSPDKGVHRWIIDPAAWFRRVFHLDVVPAPDLTTLNARRIFTLGLAPAPKVDSAEAVSVANLLAAERSDRPLNVLLHDSLHYGPSFPAPERACHTGLEELFTGYEPFLAGLDRDEKPYRLTPFAPVLLVCASDRDAAVRAARAVLDHARTLPLATAQLSLDDLDASFTSIKLDKLDTGVWRVKDRGAINTLRFDDADHLRIDWTRSEGVLGAGRVNDALYVSLDPDAAEPKIALTNMPWEPPPFATLVESRWLIRGLKRDIETAAMTVQGFGPGDMVWSVEPHSSWELRFTPAKGPMRRYRADAGDDGLLSFALPPAGADGGTLEFERKDYAEVGP